MLLPFSGSTNNVGFGSYHHAYTNGQQYKPITYSLKTELACSVDIFVHIFKTARYQDAEENNLNKNKMFSIGGIKSRSETVFLLIDAHYCLQIRIKIKSFIDTYKCYNSRNFPKVR